MNQKTLLRNEVEVSPERFLAETSTKGVSVQDLRPKFQPIYHDEMLEVAEEQYKMLQEAKPKPHVLDEFTVYRVISVYAAQRDNLALFEEQVQRWGAEPKLTPTQRAAVIRLKSQLATLRTVITQILYLADELKKSMIERILEMDDAALELRALFGERPSQERRR